MYRNIDYNGFIMVIQMGIFMNLIIINRFCVARLTTTTWLFLMISKRKGITKFYSDITYTSSSLIWSDQIMWFFLSLFGNNHTLLYTLYSRLIWSHRRSSSSSSWAIYILYNHLNRKKITNLIISNWICLKGQHT